MRAHLVSENDNIVLFSFSFLTRTNPKFPCNVFRWKPMKTDDLLIKTVLFSHTISFLPQFEETSKVFLKSKWRPKFTVKRAHCRDSQVNLNLSFLVWFRSILTLKPYEWPASKFSLQYHHWIKHLGHENIGNDHWSSSWLNKFSL